MPLGKPFLELGDLPLANNLVSPADQDKKEFRCPLSLVRSPQSGLVQLTHVVPPDLMFKHYLYVSSTTQTFKDHFAEYAKTVGAKLGGKPKALAVDIGSNDGLLLACYEQAGMRAVGVDPAENLAAEANRKGLKTLNRYFDAECVETILSEYGPADAVSANNVFAHIDDVDSVCRNVFRLLGPEGIFVIEFPYLVTMVEQKLFDMIYHEHLSYIAVHSLKYFMEKHGFEIFDIQEVSSHGGSLRVFNKKRGAKHPVGVTVGRLLAKEKQEGYLEEGIYQRFAADVYQIKNDFCSLLRDLKKKGGRIAGYGAPAKASTILNFYGLGTESIEYLVDDNPLKQGLRMSGVGIPIVSSEQLRSKMPDHIIIFAWNFAMEIMKKIGRLRDQGVRFFTPMPYPGAPDPSRPYELLF